MDRRRSGAGVTRRAIMAQVVADQRIFWRNTSLMLFSLLIPMVLLVAVIVTGRGVDDLALVLVMVIVANAFQGLGIQLAMHRDQGVLKGLIAASMAPATYVIGKTLSQLLVVVGEIVLVVAITATFTDLGAPDDLVVFGALVLVGTIACVALAFAVTSMVSNSDAAPAVVSLAYIFLVAFMGAPIWVSSLPEGVDGVLAWLPLGPLLQGLLGAWDGQARIPYGEVFASLAAWIALAGAWSARRFRWEPRESLT